MDPQRQLQKMSEFILDHTAVSYVLWVLLVFFMLTPLVMTAPLSDPRRYGWMAWVTVADFIYTPIAAVLIDRRARDQRRRMLAVQWFLAQGPLLFSVVALYDRAPQWLGAIAYAEALVLMIWSVRRAKSGDAGQGTYVETAT